ncbi:MAG: signal peptidase I [Bacilli bacterium]|nr:signal peptidase I [Bacilli bacterium]
MKVLKEIVPYIVIILVVVLIRSFIVTPVRVDGSSMNPTLTNGEILILNKTVKSYNRMDVVVFNYKEERLIKRVIGVAGETVRIEDNTLYINDKAIDDYREDVKTADYELDVTIPEGYYFVMGDNRYNSTDSRLIGLVKADDILGRVKVRIYPFMKLGKI